MTHEDSSTPEHDPADAETTIDEQSTTQEPEAVDEADTDATADETDAADSGADTGDTDEGDAADADEGDAADADDSRDTDTEDTESDEAESEDTESDDEPEDTDEPSARKPLASMALAAAVAALIAAIVCIGYFGYTGIRSYTVDSSATQLRDESMDAAQQAVLNITSVDPTDIPGWQKRLKSSLTGDALKQVSPDDLSKLVAQGKASGSQAGKITSRIARSAVTSLDTDENSATVLVFADVTATSKDQPAQQQMGFLLTIVDVDGTRKANKVVPLNAIEYSDTGSDVSTAPGATPDNAQPKEGGN